MKSDRVITYIKTIPKYIWILAGIVLIGIFLRGYHFREWLLFSPDQVRDAMLVGDVLTNKSDMIALGAQAGNTKFHLGPLYYQFEYAAGYLFGNYPEKLAYPDLLFSILSIPVAFFLLRKYFRTSISLFLSGLFSVAYFSIFTARFAVNSNSLSFFVMVFLYGLLEMMEPRNKQRHIWAAITGISLGVAIQLHVLAFLTFPIIALGSLWYLIWKKNLTWQGFCVVVFFFLLMNIGQLKYEFSTSGSNFKHLIGGASSQSEELLGSISENVLLTTFCQIRANVNQISSLSDKKYCARQLNFVKTFTDYKNAKAGLLLLQWFFGSILVVGGYWLWISALLRRELEPSKKRFLGLILLTNLVFLGVFIPIVFQAEVHYFNFIAITSFVLLGLWLDKIVSWKSKRGNLVLISLVIILVVCNGYTLARAAQKYVTKQASDSEISILGEIEPIAQYMIDNSNGQSTIYLDGDRMSFHRFSSAFEYLANNSGIMISTWHEEDRELIAKNAILYYVKLTGEDFEKNKKMEKIGGKKIKQYRQFGNITLYMLDISITQ